MPLLAAYQISTSQLVVIVERCEVVQRSTECFRSCYTKATIIIVTYVRCIIFIKIRGRHVLNEICKKHQENQFLYFSFKLYIFKIRLYLFISFQELSTK